MHIFKPAFRLIGARVETLSGLGTGRLSAVGQGESTCTGAPPCIPVEPPCDCSVADRDTAARVPGRAVACANSLGASPPAVAPSPPLFAPKNAPALNPTNPSPKSYDPHSAGPRCSVIQGAFERQILKPVFSLDSARVETTWVPGAFQLRPRVGQGESTCVAPPWCSAAGCV
jgi:hypothetical protein